MDSSYLNVYNSKCIKNDENAIYSYDSYLNVTESLFENNTEAIRGIFLDNYYLNNAYINNENCLNDTDYVNYLQESLQ